MKRLLLIILFTTFYLSQINNSFAQCTPDPGCVDDPEEPGELCPDSLPDGTVGVPYNEVVTIIPPYEGDLGEGTVDVIKIVIDAIENIPPGLTYEANATEMYPYNSYCILISGTPTTEGFYQLIIKVTPWIEIFGFPVQGPQQVDDSSMAITINCSLTSAIITGTNISCNGESDGSATVIPVDGTAPFTYEWSNSETIENITNLETGNYSVTVTDTYSCTATASIDIIEPDEITITSTTTNVSTYGGSDGTIDITVTGGTPPYIYLWDDTIGSTTEDIIDIVFGWYSVTVTDTNLCTETHSVYIAQPNDSLCPIITTINIKDVSCNGGNDGSITVTPSNGTPSYYYEWSNEQTDSTATNLTEGFYTVVVNDDSCFVVDTVIITQPEAIVITVDSIANVSSPGADDGEIYITVSEGISPYTFLWSNGDTDENIDSLPNGSYWVQVTDSNGCIVSDTIMVYITSVTEVGSNNDIIKIYPNPFINTTEIRYYTSYYGEVELKIYNLLGQIIYSEKIFATSGENYFIFNGSSLNSGIYICSINNKKIKYIKQLVKTN